MAGLVPVKRTREEIQRANRDLLEKHRAYLASWVSEKSSLSNHAQPSSTTQSYDTKGKKVANRR